MAFHYRRISALRYIIMVFGMILIGRLFYLQIIEGSKLAFQGLNSRVQEIAVGVSRGEIVDRNGIKLTNTAQHFSIIIFPGQVRDVHRVVSILTTDEMSRRELMSGIADGRPFKLQNSVDLITAQKFFSYKLPGILVVPEKVRYGSSGIAAHVVGYINNADNKGVSGIEAMYDAMLRGGQTEYVAAMVDARQNIIPGLGYKRLRFVDGASSSNLVLTLDSRVQKIVEERMDKYVSKGAVIVMRPSTGEILAMASRPNFDANNISEYLGHSAAPLLNRAVAAYQPGSVFKLVVAAAALENELVRPNDVFFDPGYIDVGKLRFKGWDYERGGRGHITFNEAMAYSSNPVFIKVGLKVGAEKLIACAKKFGFGQKTQLEFDGEADGNIPSPEKIYPGDLANLSIGQGLLEATPLQVASLVATIVNDGVKVDPYLVSKITTADGIVIKNYDVYRGTRILSKQTSVRMKEMMAAVTRVGTGQAAYVEGVGSAGKTGSAETGRSDAMGKSINHAWFAGYAPLSNPQYVVVVFVEEGMSGGDVAAPIFREVLTDILKS